MVKQIYEIAVLKTNLTGTELVEIQEALGGIGSSKNTTIQAIAEFVMAGVQSPPVQSVQGRYGNVVINKADIGLANVDNTSDASKPISTLQQAALDSKANIAGQVFIGPVDALSLYENGVQVITVGTFDTHFDARLSAVLSSTAQLPEGGENKYLSGINLYNQIVVSTGVYKAYDPSTGLVTIFGAGTPAEPAVVMVNGQQGVVTLTSDDIAEGANNKYYIDPNVLITLSVLSGNVEIDLAGGNNRNFILTLDANVDVISFVNPPPAGRVAEFELCILQDGVGGHTFTLPANMKPIGNSDVEVDLTPNAINILSAKTFDAGVTYLYAMQEVA